LGARWSSPSVARKRSLGPSRVHCGSPHYVKRGRRKSTDPYGGGSSPLLPRASKAGRATGDGDVARREMRLGRSTSQFVLADRRRWQKPRTPLPSESCDRDGPGERHSGAGPASTLTRRGRVRRLGLGDTERSSLGDSECFRAGLSTSRHAESSGLKGARAERRAFAKALRTGLLGFGLGGSKALDASGQTTADAAQRRQARSSAGGVNRIADSRIDRFNEPLKRRVQRSDRDAKGRAARLVKRLELRTIRRVLVEKSVCRRRLGRTPSHRNSGGLALAGSG